MMSKTPNVSTSLDEKVDFILKLLSKVSELLEEQVTQQAEILEQLQSRDLTGEDFSISHLDLED
jgi:hypothetical protein